MPIRVKCEQCKKTLSVKDHLAGKKIKCPVCQAAILVSAETAPPADAGAAPAGPKAETKPAAPATTKKPPVVGKPVAVLKSSQDRVKSNGTSDPSKNGKATPPAPSEPPPENVEAEALAAFADEPKPVEEEGPPKTIDFTCEWCEQEMHLPLTEGGKQTQCINPECKRIIKVPMPKIEAKKDWRKMDRQGPAAALINQPEQPDDAWGTQNATRARQASLEQAGAVTAPPKPRRDATAWILLGVKSLLAVVAVVVLGGFAWRQLSASKQHHNLNDLKALRDGAKDLDPLLRAEMNRAISVLYLNEVKGAVKVQEYLKGAVVGGDDLNEQLFYLQIALTWVDWGGEGEIVEFEHKRVKWDEVIANVGMALSNIKDGQLQMMATREVITRLLKKQKSAEATSLVGQLSQDADTPVKSQKIALHVLSDEADAIKEFAAEQPPLEAKNLGDAALRIGFAEGYARKDEFDKAVKMTQIGGPAKDRLDACLGVAAIALSKGKKDTAAECVKEALKLADAAKNDLTDWNRLELAALAARTDELEAIKGLEFKSAGFKTRVQLEIFLAECEKAAGKIDAGKLGDLETLTVATPKDWVPLALAWEALARQHAKAGATRSDNLRLFDNRMKGLELDKEVIARIRLMVDVGTYLGAVKERQIVAEPRTK